MFLRRCIGRHAIEPDSIFSGAPPCRLVSTRGAINKGIRATSQIERDHRDRARRPDFVNRSRGPGSDDRSRRSNPIGTGRRTNDFNPGRRNGLYDRGRRTKDNQGSRSEYAEASFRREGHRNGVNRRSRFHPEEGHLKRTRTADSDSPHRAAKHSFEKRKTFTDEITSVPSPIEYTTSASQFLYGFNTVFAALKAGRREAYALHVQDSDDRTRAVIDRIPYSLRGNLRTRHHRTVSQLNRMSGNRPHNGIVLEASVLPFPPVLGLRQMATRKTALSFLPGEQTPEQLAINGNSTIIPRQNHTGRFPLVLMLDGILDEGNLGAILRAAAFLGVDAVAIATGTCAPLSTVMAKAASGACDIVPLLAVPKPSDFVQQCRNNGWVIWASVSEGFKDPVSGRNTVLTTASVGSQHPCERHPCILMIGGEGEGLNGNLLKRAKMFVTIRSQRRAGNRMADYGVDSLNVSVAAALLIEAFLRPASQGRSSEAQPSEAQPSEAQPSEAQPSEAHPPETSTENRIF